MGLCSHSVRRRCCLSVIASLVCAADPAKQGGMLSEQFVGCRRLLNHGVEADAERPLWPCLLLGPRPAA
jgi:hypothetical protein